MTAVAREIKEKKAATNGKANGKPSEYIHRDKTGYPIPDEIIEDWRKAESFAATLRTFQNVRLEVEKGIEKRELKFRELSNIIISEMKQIWDTLKCVLPYAVCPTCQGRVRNKCTVCKQRGFVSEFGYKNWFPKETIALRERSIKK